MNISSIFKLACNLNYVMFSESLDPNICIYI